MIPKTCANCEHCTLVVDRGELVTSWCTEQPEWVHIMELRGHWCGRFDMASEPRYIIPDEGQEGEADVQVDDA